MKNDLELNELSNIIIKTINETAPRSVKQLVATLQETFNLEEDKVIRVILKLQTDGIIKLKDEFLQLSSFSTYMKSSSALWYWVTLIMEVMATIMIFIIPENFYPWIYLRNTLGLMFILFFPGYALTMALFPVSISTQNSHRNLETPSRIALSLGLSFTLVSIIGLLLYYSSFGLELNAIVLSLLTITSLLVTVAILREYQAVKSTLSIED